MFGKITGQLKTITGPLSKPQRTTSQPVPTDAFEEMEQRISRIQYFYRNSDLPLAARQTVTYQKLMKLDYFTAPAAQKVLRDWHEKFTSHLSN